MSTRINILEIYKTEQMRLIFKNSF